MRKVIDQTLKSILLVGLIGLVILELGPFFQQPAVILSEPIIHGNPGLYTVMMPSGSTSLWYASGSQPQHPQTNPDDLDGDGVPNAQDLCPNDGGPIQNNGCPYSLATPVPLVTATKVVVLPVLPTTGACVLATKTADGVNVRAEPAQNASVVRRITYQNQLGVQGKKLDDTGQLWYRVQDGWVASWVTRLGGDCSALADLSISAPNFTLPPAVNVVNPHALIRTESGGVSRFYQWSDGNAQPLLSGNLPSIIYAALDPSASKVAYLSGSNGSVTMTVIDVGSDTQSSLFGGTSGYSVAPYAFVWMPDGSGMLATLLDSTFTPGVYLVDTANSAQTAPVLLAKNAISPVVSVDGDYAAFQSMGDGRPEIGVLSLKEGVTQIITRDSTFLGCTSPSFQGAGLYFLCDQADGAHIYRYDRDGLTSIYQSAVIKHLTAGPGSDYLTFDDGIQVSLISTQGGQITPMVNIGDTNIAQIQWLNPVQ